MKFAETPIQQMKVYLKEQIRTVFGGLEDGDVLEWHIENGKVVVRKVQPK